MLESQELILRGEIRRRIVRTSIAATTVIEGELILNVDGDELILELGQGEAERWAAALKKGPPSLAQKLGVDASRKAFVVGQVDDPELKDALRDATTISVDEATTLIAVLRSERDLRTALKIAQSAPHCPIWCVYAKGKSAEVDDNTVRAAMRANGYMDDKISAVSHRSTATRYRAKR